MDGLALKVTAAHLRRNAYLYIRQSTLHQVLHNVESTNRQYDLRRRAVALGWLDENIVTIDSDLGQSGASAADRAGFQRLVAEVGMNRAGIVLGLEVSRLARNSHDWHGLLELCGRYGTLILDEDGVYDPSNFNDRLLLGLKGTMSEAELHVLGNRLRGGILNKARRGELRFRLPIGYCHDELGKIVLDPDQQVQESVRLFFRTFFRLESATATVRYFRDQGLLFPRRVYGGAHRDELGWGALCVSRAVAVLHNPYYAGAYAYGRHRVLPGPNGKDRVVRLAQDEWIVLLRDVHAGYITWQQFEGIRQTLEQTAKAYGKERRHGPAREGPALLQGRVICGRCGGRMSVRYHNRKGGLMPTYLCVNRGPTMSESPCQSVPGWVVDEAIGRLVIEAVEPDALELAVAVQDEIQARLNEADRHHRMGVERAQYEADLARQRYMRVDPNNRLVADGLEADWNQKLRTLAEAQSEYEERQKADRQVLNEEARCRIRDLARHFPAVWNDPTTSAKNRKRMLRLLIHDVTLLKSEWTTVHVRYRGGATKTLELPIRKSAWQTRSTAEKVIKRVDQLVEEHPDLEVAEILHKEGMVTGAGEAFTPRAVKWLRHKHRLKSLRERLGARGMLTTEELCERLGLNRCTIRQLRRSGSLRGRVCNNKGDWMYHPPGPEFPCRNPSVTTDDGGKKHSAATETARGVV